jgi:hypothetical protein
VPRFTVVTNRAARTASLYLKVIFRFDIFIEKATPHPEKRFGSKNIFDTVSCEWFVTKVPAPPSYVLQRGRIRFYQRISKMDGDEYHGD